MAGISRDPEKARRQLQNLSATNPRLAARLAAGELPGWPGVLPGTEHLHPEIPTPPPAPPDSRSTPGALPETAPLPEHSGSTPGDGDVVVLPYREQEPVDAPSPAPEPTAGGEPDAGPDPPDEPGPDTDPAPAAAAGGALRGFADGFLGRL